MNHRECRNLFVELLYGELSEAKRADVDAHLRDCSECRGLFEELRLVANTMTRRTRTELTRAEWVTFWNTLEATLTSSPAVRRTHGLDSLARLIRPRPHWVFGLAAVMLVVVGVFIGRLMVPAGNGTAHDGLGTGLSAAERILLNERALNYLERSKVLLLGIVNSGAAHPGSDMFMREQQVSRVLVTEAAGLKHELSEADEQRMKQLITDLEVILLQIANLEEQTDFPALEIVKSGVERRGILLKINLEQMRSQPEGNPPGNHSPEQQKSRI